MVSWNAGTFKLSLQLQQFVRLMQAFGYRRNSGMLLISESETTIGCSLRPTNP
jgi:hypothetical protein